MAVPTYIYLVMEILMFIINQQKEMSLLYKDLIQSFGSIISIISVIFSLYIEKFIVLFVRMNVEKKRMINKQKSSSRIKIQNGYIYNSNSSLLCKNVYNSTGELNKNMGRMNKKNYFNKKTLKFKSSHDIMYSESKFSLI